MTIDHKLLLLRTKYDPGTFTPDELYKQMRGTWKLDPSRAEKADYVCCVYKGVIEEVWEADGWYKALTTPPYRERVKVEGRWEFMGRPAPDDIRRKYLKQPVPGYFSPGNANPIRYSY